MTNNFKHYFTLVMTTFMGPADRGEERNSEYMRRKRDAERQAHAAAPQVQKVDSAKAHELEYMI